MNSLPTLIVLADPSAGAAAQEEALASLGQALQTGLACGLPLVLVATGATATFARSLLPGNDVVELPPQVSGGASSWAKAVAAGVLASPHAPGWLLLPADMSAVSPDTIRAVAQGVGHYPMVFPQYRQQRGHPVGLSSEFYSELIRLESERDLGRLMTRYPALGVDVNDPGILAPVMGQDGLVGLRSQLQGAPRVASASAALALV